ncbi:MAG: J domain-containing protein [Pseudomonadota bacterium]
MKAKSPFDFDISVTADKKRRARARGMSGAVESSAQGCDHPGCDKPGKYRAPKSPDNLDEFHWFCLEHVRAYNLKWNFFENHSEEALERQFAADKVWERPTRPFKKGVEGHPEGRAWQRFGVDDPMEVLGDKGTRGGHGTAQTQRRLPAPERKALNILEASDTATKSELRAAYKALVKVLHPDMNGGKRDDEDRLAEVVWAWETVKDSRSFRD